ncbi:peroxiredoxin [Candidatus Acetothermia bacterium]|nr:peroxiredoxin [Candidatus Acetothermia bacterium]
MLNIGAKAPVVDTVDQNGQKIKSDFKGKSIVYFYPKDDTPGCTKEACSFRDDSSLFQQVGAKVYGVSTDDATSHKAFANKYNLNFTLLADPEKKISSAFGALSEKGYASRVTYLIQDGVVKHVWPKVNPEGHSQEVLAKLKELK